LLTLSDIIVFISSGDENECCLERKNGMGWYDYGYGFGDVKSPWRY
jgi:hypothetical protein